MIRSATSTASPPEGPPKSRPAILPLVILLLIVIAAVGTAVAYVDTSTGATGYACMSISHQGSSETITTTGLLHYVNSQYYISCNEGSNLPTSKYTASCLTISPQTIPARIGVGASTEYYYISADGNAIRLSGAPAPANGTEIITPSDIFLTVMC